jgi:hypothetical protein
MHLSTDIFLSMLCTISFALEKIDKLLIIVAYSLSPNVWRLIILTPTLTTRIIQNMKKIKYNMVYYIMYFKYIFEFFHILNKTSGQNWCRKSQTSNIWGWREYICRLLIIVIYICLYVHGFNRQLVHEWFLFSVCKFILAYVDINAITIIVTADDKPVVVITHGDRLSMQQRAHVQNELAELLGIPVQQIFDIPGITWILL